MLRMKPPQEPPGFKNTVASARSTIQDIVNAGEPLTKDHFRDLWSDFKRLFHAAQHRKCGYCDAKLGEVGDVEHYRPKCGVEELPSNEELWGEEQEHCANVKGRRPTWLCDGGYWWLAYEWSNYLLACERCNRAWKGNLFPVKESPRSLPPDPLGQETPLLLSPFGAEDPVRHLAFDSLGNIAPRDDSVHGWETIRTCGLDRESLRSRRESKARRVYDLVRRLGRAEWSQSDTIRADLRQMGRPEEEFAGMVRSIFESATGVRWDAMFGDD